MFKALVLDKSEGFRAEVREVEEPRDAEEAAERAVAEDVVEDGVRPEDDDDREGEHNGPEEQRERQRAPELRRGAHPRCEERHQHERNRLHEHAEPESERACEPPRGVARTLGVPADKVIPLGDAGLNRPVRFVARKSMFSRPLIQSFYLLMLTHAQAL